MGTWNPGPGGTNGDDTFVGNATNETIQGLDGQDNLQGNGGDDTFIISAASNISGGDYYSGGDGNDVMRLTAAGIYNFAYNTGIQSIETLRLEANLTANFTNSVFQTSWDQVTPWTIDGGGRTATFNFYDDAFRGYSIVGWNFTNGNFTINMYGVGESTSLGGSNIADTLTGTAGNDELRGNGGADRLIGGLGNDIYHFSGFHNDAAQDIIVELDGGGIDTIETDASLDLSSFTNVENLESETNSPITLTGNNLANTIIGGSFANDTLIGGGGNDRLQGRSGTDTLIGGLGDDTYVFSQESAIDIIIENPNEGTDTVIISGMNTATVTSFSIANYANVENLNYDSTSTSGTRTLAGNSMNNVITATGGVATSDTIDGGAGDDTMNGGGGADTYIVDSLGDVVIEMTVGTTAAAIDTIRTALSAYELSWSTTSLVENLTYTGAGAFVGAGNNLDNIITGSGGADHLSGADGVDRLNGGLGDDTLDGGFGADVLDGGGGSDTVSYALGSAVLVSLIDSQVAGAANGDTFGSIENVTGSAFQDTLGGTTGANVLTGLAGDDALIGYAGADVLDGGIGFDTVEYMGSASGVTLSLAGGLGSGGDAQGDILIGIERIIGSSHADVLAGAAGAETLDGHFGDDILQGGEGDDTLLGGVGSDQLNGGLGADVIDGGDGFDTVRYDGATAGVTIYVDAPHANTGEAAGDTLTSIEGFVGSTFNDYMVGGAANNVLQGFVGADILEGHGGDDLLDGGDGDDNLQGGLGGDILDGGGGFDVARYDGATSGVTIYVDAAYANQGEAAGDFHLSIEGIVGSTFNDYLVGGTANNILQGYVGDDILEGHDGDDLLDGGDGNDQMNGGAGSDIFDGGAGFDTVRYDGATAGVIAFMTDAWANTGEAAGDAYISIESLYGSNFNDTLAGASNSNELQGFDGIDFLYGYDGNDFLGGGAGDDFLDGGTGLDQLQGDAGDDQFIFRAGESDGDSVLDFLGNGSAAGDTLLFLGYGTAAQGATFVQIDATHWQINSADGLVHDIITVANGASIDASDYIFGP